MPSVLFVCLGNICRSPAAEGVFKSIVENGDKAASFVIDSCGTGGGASGWYKPNGMSYHEGECADSRMTKEAEKRGYSLTSIARPLNASDIDTFDYIICMEDKNSKSVLQAAEYWGGDACQEKAKEKITLMTEYCTKFTSIDRVPDPWYQGRFDYVLDILEDACNGLYEHIMKTEEMNDQ